MILYHGSADIVDTRKCEKRNITRTFITGSTVLSI